MQGRESNGRVFYDQMQAVESYLTAKSIPKKLAVLIRKHYRQHFLAKVAMQESGLLDALPATLRKDLSTFLIDGRYSRHAAEPASSASASC